MISTCRDREKYVYYSGEVQKTKIGFKKSGVSLVPTLATTAVTNSLAEVLGQELLDPRHVGRRDYEVELLVLLVLPAAAAGHDEAVHVGRLPVSVHFVPKNQAQLALRNLEVTSCQRTKYSYRSRNLELVPKNRAQLARKKLGSHFVPKNQLQLAPALKNVAVK